MSTMGSPHSGDAPGMAGMCQPVVDGGPDPAPIKRRIALALVTCDKEDDAVACGDRALEAAVDRFPCAIEAVAVEVDRPVGLHASRSEAPIPTAIQCRALQRLWPIWSRFCGSWSWNPPLRFQCSC